MEQHTGFMLQSHWHSVGLTLGCPHLISVMETPSGPYVQLTLVQVLLLVSSLYHPYTFFVLALKFCCCFTMFWLICSFLTAFLPFHLHRMWYFKIPVGQIIVPPFSSKAPLSVSLSLWKDPMQLEPRRLKRGAWERRNKGLSVCSHHHSAPPLPPLSVLPSLGPLAQFPLPTGQRSKLRLQTRKWAC